MNLKPARLACALVALVAAPAFAQTSAGQTSVTVNGKAIPLSKIELAVKQEVAQGKQPDSPQLRAYIKQGLVVREVLLQAADKQGFGTRPEVKATLENARQSIIINAMQADFVKKHPVTDAELKAEYDRYKAQRGEKEYHVRHILVATEDEAKAAIAKLKAGSKFDELAKSVSKDRSAPNGGDLVEWVSVNDFVPEFSNAMAALQKGGITDVPVKTQYGYHVIKQEDVRPSKILPLEEVKQQASENIQQRKLQAFRDDLMKKAKIE
ncbi:MAG: peptidyl-prolyl cis-trans isomerase [Pseudomonadota bacterium]